MSFPTGLFRHPKMIGLVLFCMYCVTSVFVNPSASLLTDVGGKTATLQTMVDAHSWDLDLGYWFETHDPDGRFFPLANTSLTTNGKWVNSTSYTMIYPARILWGWGGARLAVAVPILGAVSAALAAGALERRLHEGSDGAISSWIVGIATPVVIYGFEIWEHSWGLALMAVGIVKTIDAVGSDRPDWAAFMAGAAFGLAGTMRQEALVYGVIAGLVLLAVLTIKGTYRATITRGSAMAAGSLALLAPYTVGEIALFGSSFRLDRTADRTSTLGVDFTTRLEAGAVTTIFATNSDNVGNYIFGTIILVALALLGAAAVSGRNLRPAVYGVLVVSIAFAATLVPVGLSFVPGLFPTTPLAALGLGVALYCRQYLPLALGVLPALVVVLVQYSAGSFVQWGGRYLLATGLVLLVVAIGHLQAVAPRVLGAVAGLGFAITAFGLTWLIVRENQVAADLDRLSAALDPAEVVLWRDPNIAREAGALSANKFWLSAPSAADQTAVAAAMQDAGVQAFIWIDGANGELESFAGYQSHGQTGHLEFFDQRLTSFIRVDQP